MSEKTFLTKIKQAKALIRDTLNEFENKRVGLLCSFGKDSMVLLHLCREIDPNIKVYSLVSDTEFDETYQYIRFIVETWNLNYHQYDFMQKDLIDSPGNCCNGRKVSAMQSVLAELDCWIAGVRGDEGTERKNFAQREQVSNLVKINPILAFSEADIWRYLAINNISVHPLYSKGYRSLGCRLCSTPERGSDQSERDGRWRGTSRQGGECGIHLIKAAA
ncbi:phosphoadenosine phosphosulfate reductase [Coxiella burnetii]|uniref:Phosphoadenosine phosphosulfate reductase n=1 Tax=Coxiella burnetii (strain Dugway 5J108-111) TaxID=434922 RepID=A9KBQ9_COXBN|nr:phosphoadenylyl-sulfate reductase [Coxiella burnetii]ABS78256.1 phosphoadenosine phosphosulfate reductase [Coxiella burnetii Dugway 5J108-111]OYK82782.1 phosphoadenosine phosphosulfate reductase [Coxiella burnetii]